MKQIIYAISDSSGETANNFARSMLAQFSDIQTIQKRFSFVQDTNEIHKIMQSAQSESAIIFYTLNNKTLDDAMQDYASDTSILLFDVLNPYVKDIETFTKKKATHVIGSSRQLTARYFKRIEAIDFAAANDDGKNPHGILEADVILLGISRTSKTPLSFFLANEGIKAMNWPLVPGVQLPPEIWQIDAQHIVGLTNDEEVLRKIREERMRAYGLTTENNYSNIDKIRQELQAASDLYDKLGCLVLNVANKSIEEIAAVIENKLHLPAN
ncbi:pyruvate, water dikinase regulatory protein [Bombilactobacillus thymidiniphilus]|uniref:Putative pyruvate, phosphate dikinase regulatory protein n=1 Tax=Bombilactobacillus thymidiniphilus TaxID=2923363 RepID=A0ABY4PCP7_9LACO|nr:pyruvate, water dikinase regulatory protein [Bombilactobacillus thymidiniphilus]UQS83538.1 kinase/pyrophosphorylase [Bombilactobacillus thymidiniphilus]